MFNIYFVASTIATLFDHSVLKKLNIQLYKGCLSTRLAPKEAVEMDRMSNAADEKHEQHSERQGNKSQKTSPQLHSWSRSSSLENKHSQHTLLPRKHSRQITSGVPGVAWNIFNPSQQQHELPCSVWSQHICRLGTLKGTGLLTHITCLDNACSEINKDRHPGTLQSPFYMTRPRLIITVHQNLAEQA